MAMTDSALWQRISRFSFDEPDAAFRFSERLARENGWTESFAARAIAEYRRFAYLCCVSADAMTPPVAVDEVWHLHLVYTRNYWQRFCGDALGRPLHHGPTKGGGAERTKFRDWYDRTLALYAREFGVEPPSDLWPPSAVRFDPARQPRKVDPAQVWVIAKPSSTIFRPLPLAVLAITAIAMAGCSLLTKEDGSANVGLIVVLGAAAVLVFRLVTPANWWKGGKNGGNGCGSSCGGDSGCGGGGGCGSGCGGGD